LILANYSGLMFAALITLPHLSVSSVGEFVPGYETSTWYGIGAPKKTPPEIVERLNKDTNGAIADPKIKARLADLGATVLPGSPADFGKLIAATPNGCGTGGNRQRRPEHPPRARPAFRRRKRG
jgi:hypothetical protein